MEEVVKFKIRRVNEIKVDISITVTADKANKKQTIIYGKNSIKLLSANNNRIQLINISCQRSRCELDRFFLTLT